jgi:hypothetical protein
MSNIKEYIVTLKNFEDLNSFYEDMETPGGNLYIPDRSVEVALKRPISRNTHYYLTDEEAVALRNDSRISSVSLLPADLGLEATPLYTQSSLKWDKSSVKIRNDHRNWGLYRCTLNSNITNWGWDATTTQIGSIDIATSGKNVDVVICDGHIDPDHPEFAVNNDGTGGSRVNQYNWFQHNFEVLGTAAGTYIYPPYVDQTNPSRTSNNDHGCHVAGTACGNTQGWARDANIYNINPYGSSISYIPSAPPALFDYVRAFHRNKPINSETGRKNPTIVNNSWGYFLTGPLSTVGTINYRGTEYTGPFTKSQALSYGIFAYTTSSGDVFYISTRYAPMDADVEDAINEGIMFVGGAGNNFSKIASSTDIDYNNVVSAFIYGTLPYMRGTSPSATANSICVGAVGEYANEAKAQFSNCGSRINVYAPGSNIMSSVNSDTNGGTYDYRNASKFITKYNGTSMASPQVAGLLACALELYPTMNQTAAVTYIESTSKLNQMTNTNGGPADFNSLQGSVNRYLYYTREHQDEGQVFPKQNVGIRRVTGQIYPRPRIYSYGRQTPV